MTWTLRWGRVSHLAGYAGPAGTAMAKSDVKQANVDLF